jgi:uncharacterized protein
MSELIVRKLLIDLTYPIEPRWMGGDAFRTAFYNALSMSFPRGEQYFIDSIRNGLKMLPRELAEKYQQDVKGFIGQEATHRRIHSLFNEHLTAQGLVNAIERRSIARIDAIAPMNYRNHLAATAANEHLTAIFAHWMLNHPEIFNGTEERLKTMWLWHSAEETEHRSIAFDIYKVAGGDEERRIKVFRLVTKSFLSEIARQVILNLYKDKALFRISTWRSAYQFLFSAKGLVTANRAAWKDYLREDFHPHQQDGSLSQKWLEEHSSQFTTVGFAQA